MFHRKNILLVLALFSFGCTSASREKTNSLDPQIKIYSCLETIKENNPEKSLATCSQVVKKFPNEPEPLSDRSLIYTLMGENNLACIDVKNALNIIRSQSKNIDPLIKYQIKVRHDSCKKL